VKEGLKRNRSGNQLEWKDKEDSVDKPKGVVTEVVKEKSVQKVIKKKPAKKSMKDFIVATKKKEELPTIQRADDWVEMDIPSEDKAAFLKDLQDKRLLVGYDPKSNTVLVLKPESRQRIDNGRKKEEL